MYRFYLIFSLVAFSGASYATCYGNAIQHAPAINVDLSDKLSPTSPTWTGTYPVQFSGSFTCSSASSEFGYTELLSSNDSYATVLGFNNGKYYVRAKITDNIGDKTLNGKGLHNASELGQTINVQFTLVDKQGMSKSAAGNTNNLGDIFLVTDLSGRSASDKSSWRNMQQMLIISWLASGYEWVFYKKQDMYGQPMTVTYAPKPTTCTFSNAGVSVVLPTMGIKQIVTQNRPGYTPFTIDLRCDNLNINSTANRAIDVFLSSNTLHSGDPSVLIDSSPQSAQGVGLRIVKRDTPLSPVVLSSSTTSRGSATSLFSVNASAPLSNNVGIPMGVYYYTWAPKSLTQGTINTTATLNIVYP
ncbi:fimbrial protein [uncultured Pluralibacter sp.]|uniref:fimbrial protein n=1 Tax=uncultured Pluralibacter sp. TaxID=1490864 RepID=UPI00260ED143|nr:fimbrial protein [uncultured Pluralibacter sp.]